MALQDLCSFQDVFLDSLTSECSSMPFGKTPGCWSASPFSGSTGVFNFFITVAEYLDESPIQFGQISSDFVPLSVFWPAGLHLSSSQSVPLPFPMAHGTTTLAFTFQGGVLAAVDTKLLSHMLHPFKGTELCVAAMLCGWDGGDIDARRDLGDAKTDPGQSGDPPVGPSLCYICSDSTRLQGTLFSVGSGSPYAYSILEQGVRWGLTVDEATSVY